MRSDLGFAEQEPQDNLASIQQTKGTSHLTIMAVVLGISGTLAPPSPGSPARSLFTVNPTPCQHASYLKGWGKTQVGPPETLILRLELLMVDSSSGTPNPQVPRSTS